MKVLLREDVDNLGYAGDLKEVAAGYGRNYLLPNGLAVLATNSAIKQAESWREQAAARREELHKEYEALSKRLHELPLTFEARAGETGKLYGSVTTNDVADQINETLGLELDRRKVIGESLRELGEHRVTVRLSPEFQPQVVVTIKQEGEEEEAALDAVEEAAMSAEVSSAEDLEEEALEAAEMVEEEALDEESAEYEEAFETEDEELEDEIE